MYWGEPSNHASLFLLKYRQIFDTVLHMEHVKMKAMMAIKQTASNTTCGNAIRFHFTQGCCLTGAWSPGAPKLRVQATKFFCSRSPDGRLSIDFPFSSLNDFNFLVTLFHWRKIYPVQNNKCFISKRKY